MCGISNRETARHYFVTSAILRHNFTIKRYADAQYGVTAFLYSPINV